MKVENYEYHKIWNQYHPNNLIIPGDGYDIHHIDRNQDNNSPENLIKLTHGEHTALHNIEDERKGFKGKKHTKEAREKISKANLGKIYSKETRKKISDAHIGMKASEESKRKMSASRKGKNYHPEKDWSGENNPMYGRRHSKGAREKMSKARKGKSTWNKGLKLKDMELYRKTYINKCNLNGRLWQENVC